MSLVETAKPSEGIALRSQKTRLLLKVTLLRKVHEAAQKELIRATQIADQLNIDTSCAGVGDSPEDGCSESLAEDDEEVEGQGDIVSEHLLLHSGMEA
jgi:hypothetical protein